MTHPSKETLEEREARRDAAYERGWTDSLRAFLATSSQPFNDIYDYMAGWHACAAYRWAEPINRGVAVDPTFRVPRL